MTRNSRRNHESRGVGQTNPCRPLIPVGRFRTFGPCGLALALAIPALWFQACAAAEDEESVRAFLEVPPAPTRVLGDDIPLVWRFKNEGAEAVAFMWEGCCRLNGRLTVTKDGRAMPPVPPGSSLAHQFARAEQLEPGVEKEFPTRLSDWVQLSESGRYQISGHYTGVLPTQRPQTPPDLRLWRGQATTPSIQCEVLDVADYLEQRVERSRTRGLFVTMTGPESLPPLEPAPLAFAIENRGRSGVELDWPGGVELWIVDASGRRLGTRHFAGASERIHLAPGTRVERGIPFGIDDLHDAPFGDYTVFVDLPDAGPGAPRLPSSPVTIAWRLGSANVADLIQRAASGAATGLRNPALKLLRVHLGELRPILANLDPAAYPERASGLAEDLALAACLKPFREVPGMVDVQVTVSDESPVALGGASIDSCWDSFQSPPDPWVRIGRVLDVRRHLGWTVSLVLEPEPETRLGRVMDVVRAMADRQSDLAGPPSARIPLASNLATNSIRFQARPTPANLLVRLERAGENVRIGMARRLPDPDQPQLTALFRPEELDRTPFSALTGSDGLSQVLQDGALKFPQVLVLADASLRWDDVVAAARPLVESGRPFDLVVVDGARE